MTNVSPQQRLRLALICNPRMVTQSNCALAETFETSSTTVLRLRRRLEESGAIGRAVTRIGRDDIARCLPFTGRAFPRIMAG
jgi:hypothetical protein